MTAGTATGWYDGLASAPLGSTATPAMATLTRMTNYCDCECMGCNHFHAPGGDLAEGRDAHHTRLLLALDRSIAAACRSRGVDACNGLNDDAPCEVGTLHTRAAEFAIALAAILDEPRGTSAHDRAHDALEALLLELAIVVVDRQRAP